MKIEYRTPAGTGTYTTLADDSSATLADKISAFAPSCSKSPQVEPLAGGASPFIQDRGNQVWALSFLVERTHASADAALLFITTEATIFAAVANFDLKITQGAQVLYLTRCALTGFQPDPASDRSSRISYAFVGKTFNATAP
jgi:hypothetical protein